VVTPVFVLGRNRSGTTWLANQLCEHPQIVGCQHERHYGIDESAYFGLIDERYGDLSNRVNYVEFVEVWGASDYCRLAGATKEFLYSLWPTTYEDVFREVMDRFAEREGASAWVAKWDVLGRPLRHVATAYPDARFIGIIRHVVDQVASYITLAGDVPHRRYVILRMTLGWVYGKKVLEAFASRSQRVRLVRYEDFRANTEGVLKDLVAFLGLPWDPKILGQTYKPNTSFRASGDRKAALSRGERWLVRLAAAAGRLIPRCVLEGLHRFRKRRGGRKPLPHWFFRLDPFFKDDPNQYDVATDKPPGSGSKVPAGAEER